MSIGQDGFLSPDIAQIRAKYRSEHPDAFQMITEINRVAQSALPSFETLQSTTKNLFACGYYIRALQNLQGAVLMAEHGLMSEAYTLVRSGLESVFYLGATIKTENIQLELGRDHVKRMRAVVANYKMAVPDGDPEVDIDELEAVLRSTLPEGVDPARISIETFATRAGLSSLYDSLYRQLSVAHAHPSLLSLSSIWKVGEDHETTGVLWGPERGDPEEITSVLHLTFIVMYNLLAQWGRLLEQNNQPDTELHQRILHIGEKYHVAIS